MTQEVNIEHRIGRVVGKGNLENGNPSGAQFKLREDKGEISVSGDCIESVDQDLAVAAKKIFDEIIPKRKRSAKGFLAWFVYGHAKNIMPASFKAEFDNPTDDPSHVGIFVKSISESEKIAKICSMINPKTGLPPTDEEKKIP